MDGMFGKHERGPLERFLAPMQQCGKKRVVDNARKTCHNAPTTMSETIHTVHLDFVASVLAGLSTSVYLLSMSRVGVAPASDRYR